MTKRSLINKSVLGTAGIAMLATGIGRAENNRQENPNIIMLLVDDLGWKDIGFNGSRFYETPNIDKLAAKSMIFNNAYAACTVSVTGTPLPPDRIIDGRDISPVFYGKQMKQITLYWHFPHYRVNDIVPYSIIRDNNWKLIKWYEGKTFELYNLKIDPSETSDLTSTLPSRVRKLNRKLENWLERTGAKMPVEK